MSENNEEKNKKTDWSRIDARLRAKKGMTEHSEIPIPSQLPVVVPSTSTLPDLLGGAPLPDFSGFQGIIARFKQKAMGADAALKQAQKQYDAYLDALGHALKQAVRIHDATVDARVNTYLLQLNKTFLDIAAELETQNMESRQKKIIEITEKTMIKVNDVKSKDWPQEIIDETVDLMFTLQKRVVRQMMQELGRNDADE